MLDKPRLSGQVATASSQYRQQHALRCSREIRFYLDSEGRARIHDYCVSEDEVVRAFANMIEDGGGRDGARVAIGRTDAGRFLRVIYVPDPEPDFVFVVTAHELGPKALWVCAVD